MPGNQHSWIITLLAICGIIGPIVFTIMIAVLGLLQPDHSHIADHISELGARGAPNAVVMNIAGFMLLGVLILFFSFGLYKGIHNGKNSIIGPVLLAISGIGYIAVGFFPCDPGCLNTSITGIMHVVSARIHWIGMILALLFISSSFKRDPKWKNYRLYTLASAVAILILALTLVSIGFWGGLKGWVGAIQRVWLGVRLLWIEVIAFKLLDLSISKTLSL